MRVFIIFGLLMVAPNKAWAADPVRALAHYECLWWSADQMANLDPNHPPPRGTRVRLDRWEYSDPVGVPHPETVLLVVTLSSGGAQKDLSISVRTQWLGGRPAEAEAIEPQRVSLDPGVAKTIEFRIPVEATINKAYPKRLRSSILSGPQEIAHAELPIILGD